MRLNKKKIMLLRAKRCMSASELAEKSGVCTVTIRRGFTRPVAPETAGKIAAALDVSVEEIIIEED